MNTSAIEHQPMPACEVESPCGLRSCRQCRSLIDATKGYAAQRASKLASFHRLTRSFPSLHGHLASTDEWSCDLMLRWLAESWTSYTETMAIAFVLSVWGGGSHGWYWDHHGNRIGWNFDVIEALTLWDSEHRAVFVHWARTPWWG